MFFQSTGKDVPTDRRAEFQRIARLCHAPSDWVDKMISSGLLDEATIVEPVLAETSSCHQASSDRSQEAG